MKDLDGSSLAKFDVNQFKYMLYNTLCRVQEFRLFMGKAIHAQMGLFPTYLLNPSKGSVCAMCPTWDPLALKPSYTLHLCMCMKAL